VEIRLIGRRAPARLYPPAVCRRAIFVTRKPLRRSLVQTSGVLRWAAHRATLGARATGDRRQTEARGAGGRRASRLRPGLLSRTGGRNRALTVPGGSGRRSSSYARSRTADRIPRRIRPGTSRGRDGVRLHRLRGVGLVPPARVEVAAVRGLRVPLARVLGRGGRARAGGHPIATRSGADHRRTRWRRSKSSGRVERVRTRKGRVLECDMVWPDRDRANSELLRRRGPRSTTGVLVTRDGRTSLPDVVAAGGM